MHCQALSSDLLQMAEEEAAKKAEDEAFPFLGPLPPDVIAEAEEAGADKPTAEVLRICKCALRWLLQHIPSLLASAAASQHAQCSAYSWTPFWCL